MLLLLLRTLRVELGCIQTPDMVFIEPVVGRRRKTTRGTATQSEMEQNKTTTKNRHKRNYQSKSVRFVAHFWPLPNWNGRGNGHFFLSAIGCFCACWLRLWRICRSCASHNNDSHIQSRISLTLWPSWTNRQASKVRFVKLANKVEIQDGTPGTAQTKSCASLVRMENVLPQFGWKVWPGFRAASFPRHVFVCERIIAREVRSTDLALQLNWNFCTQLYQHKLERKRFCWLNCLLAQPGQEGKRMETSKATDPKWS